MVDVRPLWRCESFIADPVHQRLDYKCAVPARDLDNRSCRLIQTQPIGTKFHGAKVCLTERPHDALSAVCSHDASLLAD
jgi:hypothetical protein